MQLGPLLSMVPNCEGNRAFPVIKQVECCQSHLLNRNALGLGLKEDTVQDGQELPDAKEDKDAISAAQSNQSNPVCCLLIPAYCPVLSYSWVLTARRLSIQYCSTDRAAVLCQHNL